MKTFADNVMIIGNHPHSGEHGHLKVDNGKYDIIYPKTRPMFRIVLDDCQHGVEECYAEENYIKEMR